VVPGYIIVGSTSPQHSHRFKLVLTDPCDHFMTTITSMVQHVWNVMAHAQKPDLVFQRNGRVHLNWPGGGGGGCVCQFSRLLAAEVCASAVVMVVMLDTQCSEVEFKTTGYPLHSHVSPSLPLPCVTVCHQVSTELYNVCWATYCKGCGRKL